MVRGWQVLCLTLFIVCAVLLVALWQETRQRQEQECVTMVYRLMDTRSYPPAWPAVGEVQLCGYDLEWSGVYAPSIEEWKGSHLEEDGT